MSAKPRLFGNERGSVIILIAMLISLLVFIPIGTALIQRSYESIKLQQNVTGQAVNIARGGLVDAISWFKGHQGTPIIGQQTVLPLPTWSVYYHTPADYQYPYPDAAFEPRFSTETLDNTIGLVKEYQIGQYNSLWARYEVHRQLVDPSTVSASQFDPLAAHDVTAQRVVGGTAGAGLVWSIGCVGYVYRQVDPSVAFNMPPNEIVAEAKAATEIRSLSINTYNTTAAVIIGVGNKAAVGNKGRLNGGASNSGIASFITTPNPAINPVITGTGQVVPSPLGTTVGNPGSGTISATDVFSVPESEIKLLADIVVNSVSALPASYPPNNPLVFVNGNAVFTAANPLQGGGILYVKGNLDLTAAPNTSFGGLIFVTGNVVMTGQQAVISGVLIVGGTLAIQGTSSDWAEVIYDPQMLTSVRQTIGQYRESRATYVYPSIH